jgi:hypothetical protein
VSSTGGGTVYLVHATKPDDTGVVEIVFTTEHEARTYALDRSRDWRILAVSITRYVIAELGTRYPVAWYVNGAEQPRRAPRPGKLYPTDEA